jgi:hypothetical protein
VGDWSFVNVAADRLGWERGRVTIEAP